MSLNEMNGSGFGDKKKKNKQDDKGEVDTSNFSIEERLVSAVWVHERKFDKTSIAQIKINFRKRFGKAPPTKNTLYFWEKKLFSTGKVMDAKRSGRPCRRKIHIASVEASLQQSPGLSLRARAEQLSLPRTTLIKILKDDLKHVNGTTQSQHQNTNGSKSEIMKDLQPKQQKTEKVVQRIEEPQPPNTVPCPPCLPSSATYTYPSLPYLAYPARYRQQSGPAANVPPDQNYVPNVGMTPHVLTHTHPHHMQHVNHTYQTHPQMCKYDVFHGQ